jgi:hypothetical protein
VTAAMRPFDWKRDCPQEFGGREFPPVVGTGRGIVLKPLREMSELERRIYAATR